jgi:RodZ C-terminal domain
MNAIDSEPQTEPSAELVTAAAEQTVRDDDLARLYQPRELEIPVVETRDGPIADIDPDTVGTLAPPSQVDEKFAEIAAVYEPMVREVPKPPLVNVVAEQPAWVRVYLADGSILFEKILDKGEAYTLPLDVEAPLLRAGNAQAVYLLVDNKAFGPVGQGSNVVKQVSLLPGDISANQPEVTEVPKPILEFTAMQASVELEN